MNEKKMYKIVKVWKSYNSFNTSETKFMTWEQAVKYFNKKQAINSRWYIVNELGQIVYES